MIKLKKDLRIQAKTRPLNFSREGIIFPLEEDNWKKI